MKIQNLNSKIYISVAALGRYVDGREFSTVQKGFKVSKKGVIPNAIIN